MLEKETSCLEHVPNLVLKLLWASLVTDNISLSVHTASAIGSLTCRCFY